jgi:hypothetical protein
VILLPRIAGPKVPAFAVFQRSHDKVEWEISPDADDDDLTSQTGVPWTVLAGSVVHRKPIRPRRLRSEHYALDYSFP